MRKIKITSWYFLMMIFLLESCHEKSKEQQVFNKNELINYFETDNIQIKSDGNSKVELIVNGSSLVQKEQQKKKNKWTTAEAYSSIGALILSSEIEPHSIDSIVAKVENNGRLEVYSYSVEDLIHIRKYVDTCIKFVKLVGEKQYAQSKNLLGNDIVGKMTHVELDNLLSSIFLSNRISNSVLIAFKVHDGIAGLYMNIYYEDNSAQTYIFNFRIDGDGRIAGISTP